MTQEAWPSYGWNRTETGYMWSYEGVVLFSVDDDGAVHLAPHLGPKERALASTAADLYMLMHKRRRAIDDAIAILDPPDGQPESDQAARALVRLLDVTPALAPAKPAPNRPS